MLYFTVQGQTLACVRDAVVSDSIDYIECRFVFDSAWTGLSKTAQFTQNGITYNVVLSGNCCRMPNEIRAGEASVSVFGVRSGGTLRITTESVTVRVLCSGFVSTGTTPVPPTPDLYSQLVKKVEDAAESVPTLVDSEISEKALLSQNDVLASPDDNSPLPVSGKALAKAVAVLSEVARTGSYSALSDRPSIPTKISDLSDDSEFLTAETAESKFVPQLIMDTHSCEVSTAKGKFYLTTARGGKLYIGGDPETVFLNGLMTPTEDTSAATKKYVDDTVTSAITTALNTAV